MQNLAGMTNLRAFAGLCHVLVVDDDAGAVGEYAEIARSLGYDCVTASDARDALRIIVEEPRIGIVVTDLQIPSLDGLSFLDELAARFSGVRPIVSMVVTGHGSLEMAVEAMRLDASDFLTKPVSYQTFSQALRRAFRKWTRLSGNWAGEGGVPLSAIDEAVPADAVAARTGPVRAGRGHGARPDEDELLAFVKSFIRTHERRGEFLDTEMFTDPAWSVLLDLVMAKLENKPLAVSSACVAAGVPMSTALRHIRILVSKGYARRWQDPNDRRRDLLMIEDKAMKAVTDYLMTLWKRVQEMPGQ